MHATRERQPNPPASCAQDGHRAYPPTLRAVAGGISGGAKFGVLHAATALSSLSAPRMTIVSASSGNGRCNAFASSHGARIQTSRSSSVSSITGIAFGWIGATTAFGVVVRKP